MSLTQTYHLAHKARGKLSEEASRADHDLRLLVGHANLLDSLMLDLAEAERQRKQQAWLNHSTQGPVSVSPCTTPTQATTTQQAQKPQVHIQWAGTVVKEPEEDWEPEYASDSDSDSFSDTDSTDDGYDLDGDIEMADAVALRRVASHSNTYMYHNIPKTMPTDLQSSNIIEEQDDEFGDCDDEEEEEALAQLTLTRSPSHSLSPPPPPGLEEDEEEDSEDESAMMPPSPPTPVVHQFTDKEREAIATTGYYPPAAYAQASQQQIPPQIPSSRKDFYEQGFYLPQRNPARLVSAISVC